MLDTGFHSVGSRSEDEVWVVLFGILVGRLWSRVGVIGATIVRGERGGEEGGVVVFDEIVEGMEDIEGIEAERGLQESLRRQLWWYKISIYLG